MIVLLTERGWAGHLIVAHSCNFRRNTLLEYGESKVIVSTVGGYHFHGKFEEIGYNRFYETMAWHAKWDDPYWDADVNDDGLSFEAEWAIDHVDHTTDYEANDMHDSVVDEFIARLKAGEKFPVRGNHESE